MKMTVTATYDAQNTLTAADARLAKENQAKVGQVTVTDGKARVKRDGQDVQEFELPKGVIVTSAPDWTDTFLLCRCYDRHKGGKQEFPGLWIHPEQKAQLLNFSIERVGQQAIEHDGKKQELGRYFIRIRNNSQYVAWANDQGRMIKLMSFPFKDNAGTEMVLEGYEKSASTLRPPQN